MNVWSFGICLLACVLLVRAGDRVPGSGAEYYWRDFDGTMPADAMPASPNTYIGLVVHDGHEVTAAVIDSKSVKRIYAEIAHNGGVYTYRGSFKIFCTTDLEQFQWIKTDADDIKFRMIETHFIKGGADDYRPYLIGRSIESANVGKIITSQYNPGLEYAHNDQAHRDFEFEALAYK